MSFIEVKNVSKKFSHQQVLNNLNLSVDIGEQLVIQGSSGSGKSTLLYLIGGLDGNYQGDITIGNLELKKLTDEKLADYRNKYVGFIFQFHFLLPSMSCMENIYLPSRIGIDTPKISRRKIESLAQELEVAHCLKKYPYQLSGGEQQRINIIRSISMGPKLLLCDEPTGNLDSGNSEKVIRLLREISKKFEITLLIVTHDQGIASQFDRVESLKDGMF